MPLLDVSFMLDDPMFSDEFSVTRRLNTMGTNGRVTAEPDEVFDGLTGVVTQQDPSTLLRAEDGMTLPRRIFIASRFQFIALAPGYQPDEITWNGTVYTVTSSLPYSRYGSGFYEAIAEVRKAVPPLQ